MGMVNGGVADEGVCKGVETLWVACSSVLETCWNRVYRWVYASAGSKCTDGGWESKSDLLRVGERGAYISHGGKKRSKTRWDLYKAIVLMKACSWRGTMALWIARKRAERKKQRSSGHHCHLACLVLFPNPSPYCPPGGTLTSCLDSIPSSLDEPGKMNT